jgi:AcrR family transcriptional regulator
VRGIGSRTLDVDDKRDLLLDAAERAIGRLGYTGTTMGAVAAEAQVTRPTVYAYFESKDALFAALADRVRAEFLLLQERADVSTPVETIRSTLTANLDLFVRHHAMLTVIAHQALIDPRMRAVHDEIYARVHRRHARFLDRMVRSGHARLPVASRAVAEAITGVTHRFAEQVIADPSRRNALAGELIELHLSMTGLHA